MTLLLHLTEVQEALADDAMLNLAMLRDEFRRTENHHSANLIEDAIARVQAACREKVQ
jgi:hypothetical protein